MRIKQSEFKPEPRQHWLAVRNAPYGYVIQEYWANNEDFDFLFPEPWDTHREVLSASGTDPRLLAFGDEISVQLEIPFVVEDSLWKRQPVHKHDGKWWFYDEVWVDRHGPFDYEIEALEACIKYAKNL